MMYFILALLFLLLSCSSQDPNERDQPNRTIMLPPPETSGSLSVEEALSNRRSIRTFSNTSLTIKELGQLAWAGQGVTDEARGYRTAPSAGATFPMEMYIAVTNIDGLPDGFYAYDNNSHSLERLIDGDVRADIQRVALGQEAITDAPVVWLLTGVLQRIEQRYGSRAPRFMHMEAGHIAQNIYLQSESLGIGTVVIGAFDDAALQSVLNLKDGEHPLYIMPVGKP